jgi:large subunit ribosomal protein L24
MPKHVRKGDLVMVTSGSHKGKTGRVKEVITKHDRVVIEGLNLRTKHLKPSRANPQGGVLTIEAGVHISNVSPVVDGKPTRVRFKVNADGSKTRVAARTNAELAAPGNRTIAPARGK